MMEKHDLQFWIGDLRKDIAEEALTHSSLSNVNNERLEFLGDGVLNLCLADLLYHQLQDREGKLTRICNYLRSDKVLSQIGRELGIPDVLKIGPSCRGIITDSMIAGALEALIGGVYESSGYDRTKVMVQEKFLQDERLKAALQHENPISELKVLVEKNKLPVIHREFVRLINGVRVYYHAIEFRGKISLGMGTSRKRAERSASSCMLGCIKSISELATSMRGPLRNNSIHLSPLPARDRTGPLGRRTRCSPSGRN